MTTATMSVPSVQERQGAVKFKGNPVTLIGPEVKVGSKAPGFQVLAQDLSLVTLASFKGKTLLISVVPSLDTPVCDAQTRRFNEEAATLSNVEVLTVSMDLPFAQKRWCGAAGINRVKVVSDHKEASFGTAYGILVKELRLLARSVFVVDSGGTVRYAEYVPEVTSHPNYDAALSAARQIAQSSLHAA
jgi:thiol peroxidase